MDFLSTPCPRPCLPLTPPPKWKKEKTPPQPRSPSSSKLILPTVLFFCKNPACPTRLTRIPRIFLLLCQFCAQPRTRILAAVTILFCPASKPGLPWEEEAKPHWWSSCGLPRLSSALSQHKGREKFSWGFWSPWCSQGAFHTLRFVITAQLRQRSCQDHLKHLTLEWSVFRQEGWDVSNLSLSIFLPLLWVQSIFFNAALLGNCEKDLKNFF